jgi:hypothetical protein
MSQPVDPYRGDRRFSYQRPPDQQSRYAPMVLQGPPVAPAVRSRRLPGLGLVLILLGLIVMVLSLTVLPWAWLDGSEAGPVAMPEIWQLVTEYGTHGFGGWYVTLFSYPLAVLGVLLALASVLESVALKVIWGGLAIIGLGILVLRYGFGPFAELATADTGLNFTTQEITTATIATAALVAVIFMLRMAVSTFRRIAGLILLGVTGVHAAAVWDLVNESGAEQLSAGAYGSTIGYALIAVAAFTGPRRLAGF